MTIKEIKQHHERCNEKYCSQSYFIFQKNFKFYLLVYDGCMDYPSHLDFKEMVLENVNKDKLKHLKPKRSMEVLTKRYRGDDSLNLKLEKFISNNECYEYNYIYFNAACKMLSFACKYESIDKILQTGNYIEEYNLAIQTIKKSILSENLKNNLLRQIELLYNHNIIFFEEDVVIPKTLNLTLKELKNEINRKS